MDETKTMDVEANEVVEDFVEVVEVEKPGFKLSFPTAEMIGQTAVNTAVGVGVATLISYGAKGLTKVATVVGTAAMKKGHELATTFKEKKELKRAEKEAKKAIEEKKNVQEETEEVTSETEEN